MKKNHIRAMVLAAGAGTRLRPLTQNYPKPMVPVLNKPVLEHTLDNLAWHGITDIALNLHHHPELIRDCFGNGSQRDLNLLYSYEPVLLGTAGGVKKLERFFSQNTFVVMSGDGLCDINIAGAIEFHRAARALATIVVKKVDTRFEYGVVVSNKQSRITQFVEKPSWSDVFTNTVNTGIYILEPEILALIPKGKFYDFGTILWPYLLKKRQRLYAYEHKGYWCDVGNLAEYRRAQRDALQGKIKLVISGKEISPGVWVDKDTKISPGVRLVPPCVIGKRCFIGKKSTIGPMTVIGSNAKIMENAVITDSILWDNVKVDRNVHLNNCIIGFGAHVTETISVFEGAVINTTEDGRR